MNLDRSMLRNLRKRGAKDRSCVQIVPIMIAAIDRLLSGELKKMLIVRLVGFTNQRGAYRKEPGADSSPHGRWRSIWVNQAEGFEQE